MKESIISQLQGGKYRIESSIASGGFGNTYLATQTGLERKVAIKEFFMKEYCDRDETTSRVIIPTEGSKLIVDRYKSKFLKEAQMIASLKNEHIIQIYDIFEENDTAYYVMEYVSNGSLKDKVERAGSMPEDVAVSYIRQVADALSYLHSHNILHLDVKPANILLDNTDCAILIDFGISKHYDSEGGQTSTTPVGISKGYAPIEQYQQGNVSGFTPSTDVYSLGATLFNLLTGETPPEASLVYEDGLPASIDNFSPAIKNVLETAMAPRRKDRFQSISEFVAALSPVEQKVPVEQKASEEQKPAEEVPSTDAPVTCDEETQIVSEMPSVSKEDESTVILEKSEPEKEENIVNIPAKTEDDKIGGWMAFFLWCGIGLGLVTSLLRCFADGGDIFAYVYVLLFVIVGIKAIIAFYKKKENAVPLATTYCILVAMDAVFLMSWNLIFDIHDSWGLVVRNVIWASIWLTYLYCSYDVAERLPKESRVWHKFEKYVLGAVASVFVVSLAVNAANSQVPDNSHIVSKPAATAPKTSTNATSSQASQPVKSAPAAQVDENAPKLKSALQSGDYITVKRLADQGYVPAYVPLAKYFLETPSTHNLADKYAKKAKSAGVKEAQSVISSLQDFGYYD